MSILAPVLIWSAILAAIWWTARAPRKGRDIGCWAANNRQRLAEWHMIGGPELRDQEQDVYGPLRCLRCTQFSHECNCVNKRSAKVYSLVRVK